MFVTKANKSLSHTDSTDYSLTVYLGMIADSGPDRDTTQLLLGVNDLYGYFNSWNSSTSYLIAELCLIMGYRVLAQRVNTLTCPAAIRVFIPTIILRDVALSADYISRPVGGSVETWVRVQGDDFDCTFYIGTVSDLEGDTLVYMGTTDEITISAFYELLKTYLQSTLETTTDLSENIGILGATSISSSDNIDLYYEVVPSASYPNVNIDYTENQYYPIVGVSSDHYYSVILDFSDATISSSVTVTVKEMQHLTDDGYNTYTYSTSVGTFTATSFESIIEILEDSYGLTSEEIGENKWRVYSYSEVLSIEIAGLIYEDDESETVVMVMDSYGYWDNLCYRYDDYKLFDLYTKYDSSISDVTVTISALLGTYTVDIVRSNSNGTPILSEHFEYSTDPDSLSYISNLSYDSKIVNIEIYDTSIDLSGTYTLIGRDSIVSGDDQYTSFEVLSDNTNDYPVEIALDLSESTNYKEAYILALRDYFDTALVVTDYYLDDAERIISLGPSVYIDPDTFGDTYDDVVFPGSVYLLYTLPGDTNIRSSDVVNIIPDDSTYEISLEERDYGVALVGAYGSFKDEFTQDTVLPIRSMVAIFAIENLLRTSGIQYSYEFEDILDSSVDTVNSYMGTSVEVEIASQAMSGRTLTVKLIMRVAKRIVDSYSIDITLMW